MSKFLTQPEPTTTTKGKKKPQPIAVLPNPPITLQFDGDIGGIEVALDRLASVVSGFVGRASRGENSYELFTGEDAFPVKVRLESDEDNHIFDGIVGALDEQRATFDRIAIAFERIATALEANAK